MNAEQLKPTGSMAAQEPVILRSESFEMHIPQKLASESGIVSEIATEKKVPTPGVTMAPSEVATTQTAEAPAQKADAKEPSQEKLDQKKAVQEYWREIFQVGDHALYTKEGPKPIKWDAFHGATYEAITSPGTFIKNFPEHVKKIDYEFRGEKDIGGLRIRAERVAALLALSSAFWAFDYVTGPVWGNEFDRLTKKWQGKDIQRNAIAAAAKKFVSVLNDKYATDLSNLIVDKLTGMRSNFNHQIADKGTDTLNTGFWEALDDKVNAPMIESGLRILFQVPVVGALFEQAALRVTKFQETSSLHTNFGKMVYMSIGSYLYVARELDVIKKKRILTGETDRIHKWIDSQYSPSGLKRTPVARRTIAGFVKGKVIPV